MLAVLAVLLTAGAIAPDLHAHGGGAARGFSSTISSIAPVAAAVEVRILDGDDRVELVSEAEEVVVFGYENEPYLRFTADGVFRNERSPARYLNEDRYESGPLPEEADVSAEPRWQRVAQAGRRYDWHDHRIHWMSRSDPPIVVADRDHSHRIFEWTIPGTIDGKPLAISGRLDYHPLPGQRFPRLLLLPLGVLAAAGVALVLVRRRREGAA